MKGIIAGLLVASICFIYFN